MMSPELPGVPGTTLSECGFLLLRPVKVTGKPWTGGPWSNALEHNGNDPQCLVFKLLQIGSILCPALRPSVDQRVRFGGPLLLPPNSER